MAPSITRNLAAYIIVFLAPVVYGAHVNFHECLADIQSGKWGPTGGTDNSGHPVSNISTVTAITYELCTTACGKGFERFDWTIFSQQFGSWLLPWLALVSQLPFGMHNARRNMLSVMLTVGSPALAAYSLALTVLNGRWVARRFVSIRSVNACNAVKALSSLQQAPLVLNTDSPHLLASLVTLPENERWWSELVARLEYTHTWSISAGTSVVWVIVAYVFTVIDSLQGDITQAIAAHGQGIGSVWLWLLPVVTSWLQLSPKCDSQRLRQAVEHANTHATYAVTEDTRLTKGLMKRGDRGGQEHAMSMATGNEYDYLRPYEAWTSPIYNYARFLSWTRLVEVVALTFEAAPANEALRELSVAHEKQPVGGWQSHSTFSKNGLPSPLNLSGNDSSSAESRVELNLSIPLPHCRWAPGVWPRLLLASFAALFLQWGTTGAAMLVNYFTPTYGIGCRTASYLLYGSMSTLVCILLVLSSLLSHYSITMPAQHHRHQRPTCALLARRCSIIFRITGETIAFFNAIWIVLACLFQFSNFYNRCYCNSSVIGLGAKAYNVLMITEEDVPLMRARWIVGVAVAAGSAALYMLFVNFNMFVNRNPRHRPPPC